MVYSSGQMTSDHDAAQHLPIYIIAASSPLAFVSRQNLQIQRTGKNE